MGRKAIPKKRTCGHGELWPKSILSRTRTSSWNLHYLSDKDNSVPTFLNFKNVMTAVCLPFSLYPGFCCCCLFQDVDFFFHSQHCILKWSICFIYMEKATHRELQITWRTWFWARSSDQEVIWLALLKRNKGYSMCWRKDKMIICWAEHSVVADTHQSYFFFLGLLEVYILKPLFQLG